LALCHQAKYGSVSIAVEPFVYIIRILEDGFLVGVISLRVVSPGSLLFSARFDEAGSLAVGCLEPVCQDLVPSLSGEGVGEVDVHHLANGEWEEHSAGNDAENGAEMSRDTIAVRQRVRFLGMKDTYGFGCWSWEAEI
jgi:hypothetical protein